MLLVVSATAARAAYTVGRVVGGLNQPTFMTQAPGDGTSLYIVERSDAGSQLGRIRKYDLQTQSLTTFLDMTGSITSDGGVLSMTFHPNYQSNGLFYVTSNVNGDNRLDEYKTVAGVPQFQRRLVQYSNLANVFHTINQPFFRPGGNSNELFLTTGDGGTQADQPQFNPALIESPTSVYGKLLRIDLNANFATPAGDATHAGMSVVALGLRNPYRTSFDRTTGDFYIGDVGFNSVEEVNYIPASQFTTPSATPLDFGWTSREGTIATQGSSAGGPGSPGDLKPIFEYAHGSSVPLGHPSPFYGTSITGGYLYRGPVPELQGRYFFSDFVNGKVFSGVFNPATSPAAYNGQNLTNIIDHTTAFESLIAGGANIQFLTSFAEDNAGNLYLVKFGDGFFPALGQGEIFRITAANSLDAVVNRNTGAITLINNSGAPISLASLTISSTFGAIERNSLTSITGHYDVNGDHSIDNNNAWTITSPAGSHTVFTESSTGDPGTLAAGQQLVLSPASGWIPSPTEDISVALLNAANSVVSANVVYIGNSGVPFARSDLNFDGAVTDADWAIFVANAATSMSGLSKAQSYGRGDLDGDGDNDYSDFQSFKADYVLAHGAAAFAALIQAVPEPSVFSLMAVAGAFSTAFVPRAGRSPHRRLAKRTTSREPCSHVV
ncbi:MAG: PQQ-dependent sugar dehydrogenase [Pirellulales bacterium]